MTIEFDVTGPLPQGLMVIEASAGTGKTYALTALALRSIAQDDVAVSSLCLVTFTEAATAEMRGRLRSSITEALAHLVSDNDRHPDTVIDLLGSDTAQRPVYAGRLVRALAELDSIWISTIHGWCARVLGSSGVWHAAPKTLIGGDDDVIEVTHDLVVGRYALSGVPPAELANILAAVRMRLAMPLAVMQPIEPVHIPNATAAKKRRHAEAVLRSERVGELVGFVDDIVDEVLRRRQQRGHHSFDGLLVETRRLLFDPRNHDVIELLRRRFDVVLIDEFQDTDQIQWDIFRQAFVEPLAHVLVDPVRRVVLVGDPKQSIYRFRAAELSAYLAARRVAGEQIQTLRVNRRSDPALLAGVEALLSDTTYGDEAVRFEPVRAPEGTPWSRLIGIDSPALQLRVVSDVPTDTASLRRAVRNDVVITVQHLLSSGIRLDHPIGPRPLRTADIAVLTRSNVDATSTALALSAVGIPAATASANSVLDSAAGLQWRVLLAALARPAHLMSARAAAVGWFVGQGLEHLVDDEHLVTQEGVDIIDMLHGWAQDLERGGVARLLRALNTSGWHARLLERVDGERHVTDVDHVAELLQTATAGSAVSAVTAVEVLDGLQAAGGDQVTAAMLARRIDRDDDAVQVITIHKAKGLEFPVVLCPYLWTNSMSRQGLPHAGLAGQRVIDTLSMYDEKYITEGMRPLLVPYDVRITDRQERQAEERRLAYVALTRANNRCIVWWAEPQGTSEFRKVVDQRGGPVVLAGNSNAAVEAVSVSTATPVRMEQQSPGEHQPLGPAIATRFHDRRWRVWSFSAIKSLADDLGEAPVVGGVDEFNARADADADADAGAEPAPEASTLVTRLREAPAGTRFGTAVHRILERCDFSHPDLASELVDRCRIELVHSRLAITADQLASGLLDVIDTPLGGPAALASLRHLERPDRLDELDFHLPLGALSTQQLVGQLLEHLEPSDPAYPWASAVAAGSLPVTIEGRLTGSIDLVARAGPHQQVWIADYKSNRLGPTNGGDSQELVELMNHAHYWLQAMLYLVSTHRYLRWRRPDYDPDRHLVGAAYLFLRAMTPERPGSGVLWWRPSTAAIHAVDRALAAGATS